MTGVHFFTDSQVLARVVQGRWQARTRFSKQLVLQTNTAVMAMREHFWQGEEGWWCSFIRRESNGKADGLAKWALKESTPPVIMIIDADLWLVWCHAYPGIHWWITTDGSMTNSKGGSVAVLWAWDALSQKPLAVSWCAASLQNCTAFMAECHGLLCAFVLVHHRTSSPVSGQLLSWYGACMRELDVHCVLNL